MVKYRNLKEVLGCGAESVEQLIQHLVDDKAVTGFGVAAEALDIELHGPAFTLVSHGQFSENVDVVIGEETVSVDPTSFLVSKKKCYTNSSKKRALMLAHQADLKKCGYSDGEIPPIGENQSTKAEADLLFESLTDDTLSKRDDVVKAVGREIDESTWRELGADRRQQIIDKYL